MRRDLTPQSVFAGALAAFVGFASSFAVVLQGLRGVGASDSQAASGLMVAAIAMGACSIALSLRTRMPVGVAWSTPGAALLASSGVVPGGFPEAVGAFILCGLLLALAGLFRPLAKAVEAIPQALANALLAGVLVGLCLAPFKAIAYSPAMGLPILLAWIVAIRINRHLAVPAALLSFVVVVVIAIEYPSDWRGTLTQSLIPELILVRPSFSFEAAIGIALPLFIVTMASQNLPGIAVLRANNFNTPPAQLITTTGMFSTVGAFFGAHAVNLSAIVAAMMASEEGGPDKDKRYVAAVTFGVISIVLGVFAGVTTAFVSLAPVILIEAVAGLALIGAFSASAVAAFRDESTRLAAAVTFLASASGITLWGISGAFWGLMVGLIMILLTRPLKL
ncbi:MAG: benzoate/H(+) symporter BenE family transporter [Gammaproteobacteria bacterium]|nr:benzoate/H(+) symporter BenE family transporter [Gammaproteobacteria bacterium]